MIDFISLFCTAFPVAIAFVLFILTWKSLNGANKGGRPSARFASKPKRSPRNRRTASTRANSEWKSEASHTVDAPLRVQVSAMKCAIKVDLPSILVY